MDEDSAIGVIIVNFGAHALLRNTARELVPEATVLVVLVDNLFDETEREAARRLAEKRGWLFLALQDNRGFGHAANEGMSLARQHGCGSFLVLNPDATVGRDVLVELHAHVQREPMSLVTPTIRSTRRGGLFSGSTVSLRNGRIRGDLAVVSSRRSREAGVRWLPGTCLAMHSALIDAVGGWDEQYFLYWEDVDLSYRCVRNGGRLVLRDDLEVLHDEGGTQKDLGRRTKSNVYYYYNCRNRLLFAARHLPWQRQLLWALSSPAQSWEILMRGGRRQLLHSVRPLAAAIRGTLAGLWLLCSCRQSSSASYRYPATGPRATETPSGDPA